MNAETLLLASRVGTADAIGTVSPAVPRLVANTLPDDPARPARVTLVSAKVTKAMGESAANARWAFAAEERPDKDVRAGSLSEAGAELSDRGGLSEKAALQMPCTYRPCVAQGSPLSLDSVFQTSSSDPGWAIHGPAVMRAATCHRQVGRASPLKGTDRTGSPLRGIAKESLLPATCCQHRQGRVL